jgi:hypothetical protein
MLPFSFSIDQITIDSLIRMLQSAPSKCFDERGKPDHGIIWAAIHLSSRLGGGSVLPNVENCSLPDVLPYVFLCYLNNKP